LRLLTYPRRADARKLGLALQTASFALTTQTNMGGLVSRDNQLGRSDQLRDSGSRRVESSVPRISISAVGVDSRYLVHHGWRTEPDNWSGSSWSVLQMRMGQSYKIRLRIKLLALQAVNCGCIFS